MLTALFERIKAMGARVIMGISGHNVLQQNAWINKALEPVLADETVAGIGLQEITLSRPVRGIPFRSRSQMGNF